MTESFKSKLLRMSFNLYPCYRGTGGRVTYMAADYREARVRLPLSRRTKNYVGTIFGGSLYGCLDPIYMIMLIQILGPDYIVWDKAANIRFKRPGRTTLFARFVLTQEQIDDIKNALETEKSVDRIYRVELADAAGTVHAFVDKTLYVAKKRASAAD